MSDMNTTHTASPTPETTSEVTRRRFMTLLFAGATAIGLGGFMAPLVRFAYPVLKGQVYEKLKVASVTGVTAEGVRFEYQEVPSQLIQLEDKSFAALSLVCTHLGCISKWEPKNKEFLCPCHAGKFDINGEVISGPPPKPLTRYNVVVEAGDVYVEGIA